MSVSEGTKLTWVSTSIFLCLALLENSLDLFVGSMGREHEGSYPYR